MKATIYIPDDKYKIYEQAKEKLGESISVTFLRCLERELEEKKAAVDRIIVEVSLDGDSERTAKKAFKGRWIIGDAVNGERFHWEPDSGVSDAGGFGGYSVAITQAGRIVVLQHMSDYAAPSFKVFEDYEEFSGAEIDNRYPAFPESLKQAVASDLNIERVEDLDI